MIIRLLDRFSEICLPKGKHQGKLLEDMVEAILIEEGYQQQDIRLTVEEKAQFRNGEVIERLLPGHYISQPMGNNDRPDFIVNDGTHQVGVEAKSSKEQTPMYNSGFPSEKTIYVIATSNPLGDAVRVLDGGQIIPPELKKLAQEYTQAAKKMDAEWNEKALALGWAKNPFGVSFYSRVQSQHRGGGERTSYFTPRAALMQEELMEKFRNLE